MSVWNCPLYMGVCMKRVSLEWGSLVLFLFCELDFEQPLVDDCSMLVWNGVQVTCLVGNIYLF